MAQIIWAQTEDRDFEKELNYQSKAVRDLKNEIESTRKKLRSEENREKSAARTITNLEKEISLVERLIVQLKKEETAAREEIVKLGNEIEVHENEFSLQEIDNVPKGNLQNSQKPQGFPRIPGNRKIVCGQNNLPAKQFSWIQLFSTPGALK